MEIEFCVCENIKEKNNIVVKQNNWIRRRNGFDIEKKIELRKICILLSAKLEVKLEKPKQEDDLGMPS